MTPVLGVGANAVRAILERSLTGNVAKYGVPEEVVQLHVGHSKDVGRLRYHCGEGAEKFRHTVGALLKEA